MVNVAYIRDNGCTGSTQLEVGTTFQQASAYLAQRVKEHMAQGSRIVTAVIADTTAGKVTVITYDGVGLIKDVLTTDMRGA